MLKVIVNAQRPDFRVFVGYFFGDENHNYDSDGNSFPAWSRDWTELYMRSREEENKWFSIDGDEDQDPTDFPFELTITADAEETAYIIAYFLAKETKGTILNNDNQVITSEEAIAKMGDFDLQNRLQLAQNSPWRHSSEENPFPNLRGED